MPTVGVAVDSRALHLWSQDMISAAQALNDRGIEAEDSPLARAVLALEGGIEALMHTQLLVSLVPGDGGFDLRPSRVALVLLELMTALAEAPSGKQG